MCGITSYVGRRPAEELLVEGLEQLEYRGYDSAGIALLDAAGAIQTIRAVGNLAALRAKLVGHALAPALAIAGATFPDPPTTGIGHTRWATHGCVNEANAHPHCDTSERVHIVLNGIIENHLALRHRLHASGAIFRSDTDAEVVAHLIAEHYDGDLPQATRLALRELQGQYAFVAMCGEEPGLLVAARRDCPLVVGVADDGHFIASAIPAFLAHTRSVCEVGDGELVIATPEELELRDGARGRPREHSALTVRFEHYLAEKGSHETFMRKEISEQPAACAATLAGRLTARGVVLADEHFTLDEQRLRGLERLHIVGCGTSYHAGLLGRYLIEEWARVPVDLDTSSEYRYRNPPVGARDLVLGITQSGETADTLAAMRMARRRGVTVLAITNVMGSQATRDSDSVLFTRAGIEIGVAATKTFTAQVLALALLALALGRARGTLTAARANELAGDLATLPARIEAITPAADRWAARVAPRLAASEFCMFIGRHVGLPVALEGALKLKEVSYVPTDAYAAGEMKHGPIALLSDGTPVVCVATDSPVLTKLLSNVAEVRARGAQVLAIAGARSGEVAQCVDDVFALPAGEEMLQPLLAVVPLQLLAYHVARARGLDVDQPRNLAKTVTVE